MLDLDALRALLERDDGPERAFADAMIRMRWARSAAAAERVELEELERALRRAALRAHQPLREQIAAGRVRGDALRRLFESVPPLERDHFVEEVLGIAYPALDEPELAPELVAYTPSGYDEIVHAFDATGLGPGDRFLDLGSGMGKSILLAELLTGATSSGVEIDRALVELAESARGSLGLQSAHSFHADAREVELGGADVVFMYLPFTGSALATVLTRLAQVRRLAPASACRYVCAGALDLRPYPDLVLLGPARSWLNVYAWQ